MKQIINGIEVPLTQEEILLKQQQDAEWNNGAFDRAIAGLRSRRNSILASSDWTVLSDSPLSAELKTAWLEYRQDLRDITEGVNTEAKVKAVVFPDKP